MKSWKTTLAGVGAILVAAGNAMQSWPNVEWASLIPAVFAGIGLIMARDNDKTSEDAGAR